MGETKRKVQLMPMEIDEALMRGLNPALVDEEGSIEISEEEELKVRLYLDFREVNSIDPRAAQCGRHGRAGGDDEHLQRARLRRLRRGEVRR